MVTACPSSSKPFDPFILFRFWGARSPPPKVAPRKSACKHCCTTSYGQTTGNSRAAEFLFSPACTRRRRDRKEPKDQLERHHAGGMHAAACGRSKQAAHIERRGEEKRRGMTVGFSALCWVLSCFLKMRAMLCSSLPFRGARPLKNWTVTGLPEPENVRGSFFLDYFCFSSFPRTGPRAGSTVQQGSYYYCCWNFFDNSGCWLDFCFLVAGDPCRCQPRRDSNRRILIAIAQLLSETK